MDAKPDEKKKTGAMEPRTKRAQLKRRPYIATAEISAEKVAKSVDRRNESTSTDSMVATPRSTSTCSLPPAQHIPTPPPPRCPMIHETHNSATNSDPNKLSDQTRTTSDQRNTARQSRGAMEPRRDGDTSWRERDRYNPHEKTVRQRTISELKAPSSNKQRSDVSQEATPRRDTGERDRERIQCPCFEARGNHDKRYRDWDEEYYSQEEFEAHYGENGQMCYEAAKHATTETISALLQMQRDQRTFSSLKAEVRHGVLVDAKARKKTMEVDF